MSAVNVTQRDSINLYRFRQHLVQLISLNASYMRLPLFAGTHIQINMSGYSQLQGIIQELEVCGVGHC